MSDNKAGPADHLFDTPDLAGALESDRFKQFLDHIPVAIAVSELLPSEHIIYANIEFERLTGQKASEIVGSFWKLLPGAAISPDDDRQLGKTITEETAAAAAEAALKGALSLSQNAYKIDVAKTAVKRAILRAAGIHTA